MARSPTASERWKISEARRTAGMRPAANKLRATFDQHANQRQEGGHSEVRWTHAADASQKVIDLFVADLERDGYTFKAREFVVGFTHGPGQKLVISWAQTARQ